MLNKLLLEVDSHVEIHQFACRKRWWHYEDNTLYYMDCVSWHLDKKNSYASYSIWKTAKPRIVCQFMPIVLGFLIDRRQYMYVNGKYSSTLGINIGSPQECVLSAVLFILYTSGLITKHDNL